MIGRKRLSLGLVLVMILGLAAIGSTMAYLYTESNILANAFTMGKASIEILENGEVPQGDEHLISPKGNLAQKAVAFKNTGNIDLYLRVALVPVFRESTPSSTVTRPGIVDYSPLLQQGATVVAKDCENVERFGLNLSPNWEGDWIFIPGDNLFYYKKVLGVGETTSLLLDSVSQKNQGDWNGFDVDILADGIQSDCEEDPHPIASWPQVRINEQGQLEQN